MAHGLRKGGEGGGHGKLQGRQVWTRATHSPKPRSSNQCLEKSMYMQPSWVCAQRPHDKQALRLGADRGGKRGPPHEARRSRDSTGKLGAGDSGVTRGANALAAERHKA